MKLLVNRSACLCRVSRIAKYNKVTWILTSIANAPTPHNLAHFDAEHTPKQRALEVVYFHVDFVILTMPLRMLVTMACLQCHVLYGSDFRSKYTPTVLDPTRATHASYPRSNPADACIIC